MRFFHLNLGDKVDLTKLSKDIRFDNASKGFDPTEGGVNRYLLLSISEICEAQNELRDGRRVDEVYFNGNSSKPEGFPVEIADAIIRLLDICGKFERNLDDLLTQSFPVFEVEDPIDDILLYAIHQIANARRFDPTETYRFWVDIHEALKTLFMLCSMHDIDIYTIINQKLEFNRTRPPKHGRQF